MADGIPAFSRVLQVRNVREDHGGSQLQLLLEGLHVGRVHAMDLQPVGKKGGGERGRIALADPKTKESH